MLKSNHVLLFEFAACIQGLTEIMSAMLGNPSRPSGARCDKCFGGQPDCSARLGLWAEFGFQLRESLAVRDCRRKRYARSGLKIGSKKYGTMGYTPSSELEILEGLGCVVHLCLCSVPEGNGYEGRSYKKQPQMVFHCKSAKTPAMLWYAA